VLGTVPEVTCLSAFAILLKLSSSWVFSSLKLIVSFVSVAGFGCWPVSVGGTPVVMGGMPVGGPVVDGTPVVVGGTAVGDTSVGAALATGSASFLLLVALLTSASFFALLRFKTKGVTGTVRT